MTTHCAHPLEARPSRREFILATAVVAFVPPSCSQLSAISSSPTASDPAANPRFMINFEVERINATSCAALIKQLGILIDKAAKELALIITSDGGDVKDGVALYNFLRGIRVPLTTFNISRAESVAAIVFLAGDRRIAAPNARFMIHPVESDLDPKKKFSKQELEDFTVDNASAQRTLENIYRERTTLPLTIIEESRKHEVFFDAAQAQRFGVATEIAPFSVPPEVSVLSITLS